jgi:DNA polymerase-3 subunit beta
MAQQDIRYYLNGLLLVVGGGELRWSPPTATAWPTPSEALRRPTSTEVILPRKTVLELSRQLADTDDPLDIELGGNQARCASARSS